MLPLLLACALDEGERTPYGATWTWESTSPGLDAPMDVESLEVAANDALSAALSVDPRFAHDGFDLSATWVDETCPWIGEHNGQTYYIGGCTTAEGTVMDGQALRSDIDDFFMGDDHYTYWGWFTGGWGALSPDGVLVSLVGGVAYREYQSGADGLLYALGYMDGDFHVEGDGDVDATYLGQDISVTESVLACMTGSQSTTWYIEVERLSGDVTAVTIDLYADASCDLEPTGTIALYGVDGRQYDVTLDGAGCDGCGTMTTEGEDPVEVCLDLSGFAAGSRGPWD